MKRGTIMVARGHRRGLRHGEQARSAGPRSQKRKQYGNRNRSRKKLKATTHYIPIHKLRPGDLQPNLFRQPFAYFRR
jgi:hypothetical protein